MRRPIWKPTHALTLVFCLGCACLPFPTHAADGARQIPWTQQVATPIIIDEPGEYVVTRNLQATGPGPVLIIDATAVRLDLNGMTITPDANGRGIRIEGGAEAKISNGTVSGGSIGIEAGPGSRSALFRMTVHGQSISGFAGPFVSELAIENSHFENIEQCAICLNGTWAESKSVIIRDNVVTNTAYGISVTTKDSIPGSDAFGSAVIENNRLHDIGRPNWTGEAIILVGSGRVANNAIDGSDGSAITVFRHGLCQVEGNVIHDSGIDRSAPAIDVAYGAALVKDNVVTASYAGVYVNPTADLAWILWNTLNDNVSFGLFIEGSFVLYGGNVARGNGGTGCPGVGNQDFCDNGINNVSNGENRIPTQQ